MSIQHRKGTKKKSFVADFYIRVDGKKKRVRRGGFETRNDAKHYERKTIIESEKIKKNSVQKSNITFCELATKYFEGYCKNKKSWKSDRSRLAKLVEYFGDYCLTDLSKLHVSDYIQKRSLEKSVRNKPFSGTSINRELELLRSVLNLAIEWEMIESHSIIKLGKFLFKENQVTNVLTEDQLQKLVELAPPYLKLIILIAINTGMRRGEVLNLEWERVNFGSGIIHLDKTKTSKERDIPMNETLKPILFELSQKMKGHRYVIENPETEKCYVEIKKSWKTLLKMVGINNFRFHDLRHNFATYTLLHNGGSLVTLSDILGHSTITMTTRYAHALDEGRKKLVNSFQIGSNVNLEDIISKSKK